ncbi:MAG: helix-turn-helix domain-containing protein [Chloroflexota bacterium]|nr:helix-turn-helix domain-containing protein [Chloroflexota bacterium]
MTELRQERQTANVSQRSVAKALEWQQSELNRLERFAIPNVALVRLVEIASVLGLEVSVRLHRIGDPIRDSASQALIARFLASVAAPYRVIREALLPTAGQRSWDVLLRIGAQLIGVEAVTRIRDIQALVRHIRLRERDGGVDHVLLVLSDSVHNRALVGQLIEALGPRFATPRRDVIEALKAGRPVPGSAVLLM